MHLHRERRFGALAGNGSVRWRVWAPRAKRVDLVLLLLSDGKQQRLMEMTKQEHGFFSCTVDSVAADQRYLYRLNGQHQRPDPASLWQPEGVAGPSAVYSPSRFDWSDQDWKGVHREDLVFYELHTGTFTSEGTFAAIIPRLAELRALGVTAIEVMPVGQFPGTRNWGYDGVFPYAVQNSYGGPAALQRLVDACHAAGLAIFLDVVYNHLGPEGNYLGEFAPFFTDRYRTPWGPAFNYDGPGSDNVRDFVIDNACMWIEEFHFDGLRLDAVHAICDFSAKHLLQEMQEAVAEIGRRQGRQVHLIAENDGNDPRLLRSVAQGGHELAAQWSDDFHHAVHALLTGERHGYYADFGTASDLAKAFETPFVYDGRYSPHRDRRHGAPSGDLSGDRFVVAIQNHDQVGNRARGDRLDVLVSPPARRLAASLLLLSPYLPLLFMGEEYGETAPFPFFCSFTDRQLVENVRRGRRAEFASFAWQGEVPDPQAESTNAGARLKWSWPEGLRRLYQDLLAARREWPALRDFRRRTARLLPSRESILHLTRGGADQATVQAFFNLSDQVQREIQAPGGASVLFRSESPRYHGARSLTAPAEELFPFECVVYGPPDWRSFVQEASG
jgi:maltooligosyltrehalose trehalohydrolase